MEIIISPDQESSSHYFPGILLTSFDGFTHVLLVTPNKIRFWGTSDTLMPDSSQANLNTEAVITIKARIWSYTSNPKNIPCTDTWKLLGLQCVRPQPPTSIQRISLIWRGKNYHFERKHHEHCFKLILTFVVHLIRFIIHGSHFMVNNHGFNH